MTFELPSDGPEDFVAVLVYRSYQAISWILLPRGILMKLARGKMKCVRAPCPIFREFLTPQLADQNNLQVFRK
jgi:hypothetical protein